MSLKIFLLVAVLPFGALCGRIQAPLLFRDEYDSDEDQINLDKIQGLRHNNAIRCIGKTCYNFRDDIIEGDLIRSSPTEGPVKLSESREDVVFFRCTAYLCEEVTDRIVTINDKKLTIPMPLHLTRNRKSLLAKASCATGDCAEDSTGSGSVEEDRSLQSFYDNALRPLTHVIHQALDPFLPPSLREKPTTQKPAAGDMANTNSTAIRSPNNGTKLEPIAPLIPVPPANP